MGIYDTVKVTSGEQEYEVDPEVWLQQDRYRSHNAGWGEIVFFNYEVANRRLSTYEAEVNVSVWHSQQKIADVLSQPLLITALGEESVQWSIDTSTFLPEEIPQDQRYDFTVLIQRGEVERRIILNVNAPYYPPKPVVVPAT